MEKKEFVFTLDLVPYNAVMTGTTLTIKGCEDSILSRLNNDPEVTKYRFSDERTDADFDGSVFSVSYDDGDCEFRFFNGEKNMDDIIEGWISSNYDAINEIGWELLHKEDYYEKNPLPESAPEPTYREVTEDIACELWDLRHFLFEDILDDSGNPLYSSKGYDNLAKAGGFLNNARDLLLQDCDMSTPENSNILAAMTQNLRHMHDEVLKARGEGVITNLVMDQYLEAKRDIDCGIEMINVFAERKVEIARLAGQSNTYDYV